MSQSQVTITIAADTQSAAQKIESFFAGFKKNLLAIPQLAEVFAGAVVIERLKKYSEEWIRSAKAMAQFEAALRSTGRGSSEFIEQLEKQRQAISKNVGVREDEIVVVQRELIQYKAAQEQIQRLTELSIDLAASQGTDVASAAAQVAKALGGEFVQLRGVRLELDASLPKYEQVNQLIRQLASQVGGQSRAAFIATTPEITRFNLALKELTQALGGIATGVASGFLRGLGNISEALGGEKTIDFLDRFLKRLAEITTFSEEKMFEKLKQSNFFSDPLKKFIGEGFPSPDEAIYQRKAALLNLHLQAGAQATATPSLLAQYGLDQQKNEIGFKEGKIALSQYLATRRQMISTAADYEKVALGAALRAVNEDLIEKRKELDALDKNAPYQQRIGMQEAVNKSEIEKFKISEQMRGVDLRKEAALQMQGDLEFQNPLTIGDAFKKELAQMKEQFGTVAGQIAKTWKEVIGTAISSIASGISGLIQGTETWSQALRNIGTSILNVVIQGLVNMFAAMVLGEESVAAAKLAKQAAALPGELVSALATAVSEGGWAAAAIIAAAVAALGVGVAYAAGAFAEGGRPPVGEMALVGERGPELFVPDRSGTILPANQTSAILSGRGGNGGSGGGRAVDLKLYVVPDKNSIPSWARSRDFEDHVVDIAARNSYRL